MTRKEADEASATVGDGTGGTLELSKYLELDLELESPSLARMGWFRFRGL